MIARKPPLTVETHRIISTGYPKLVSCGLTPSSFSFSSITVPKADVKKKTIKINLGARAKTKLTYKSKSKKIKVNKKGIVTLKKGTKKGTYTITITAKESKNWKKATKKIKIKVK